MKRERRQPFALEGWIVEPNLHQMSQGEITHTIEPRVMSVLLELAAHPQQVVSKDEFFQAVWSDTFVGEDALTRCISVLRHVLQDNPHKPRFIKTVSKVGYCLLVEVRPIERRAVPREPVAMEDNEPSKASVPVQPPPVERTILPVATASPAPDRITPPAPPLHSMAGPRGRGGAMTTGLLTLLLAGAAFVVVRENRNRTTYASSIPTFQVTTNAGEESRPAISPNGKLLAFVWAKEDGSRHHIYLKELGREPQLRLTDLPDSDDEYSPAWSPDGQHVAFLASSESGLALYVASLASPRSVRKVYIPGQMTRWQQGELAWSPDGRSFLLADHPGAQPNSAIYRIDAETLRAQALTFPPAGWEGDLSPAFSPDGTKIAFLRASENAVTDIFWIPAGGGEPKQVTHDGKMIDGITWAPDSESLIFSSNRSGEYGLYTIALGGLPQRLPVGTEDATEPAIAQSAKELAFVRGSAIFGILRVTGAKNGEHAPSDGMILSSTAQDSAPSLSPAGTEFAFQSWRSGTQQIWVSSIDGASLRQLTPDAGELSGSGSPSWSPSGDQILLDSRIHGHSHIFMMPAAGGTPRQITFAEANDIVPRWSADGRTVYFRSNRGGRWQLWRVPAAGGAPQPVTREDGMAGQESPDGKWLYFSRGGENGIWRMPVGGGDEVHILDQPLAGYWAYWTVSRNGIYFLDQSKGTPAISIYDPATQKRTDFAKLNRLPPLNAGLSLLHDGRGLLISDKHDAGSHISVAQGVF